MKDNNLCILIMAGGKGTRFWPKSTEEKPKQFLNLISEKTMLQLTVERSMKITSLEKIFVITGEKYKKIVQEQIPNLPEKNIIIEPVGRNTAPCILLATIYIKQIYENTNIAVLPSDHIINNVDNFCYALEKADEYISKENQESIITIGITPTRPETGYGYIKYIDKKYKEIVKVEKFVEKPNLEKAKEYLKEGTYLWNAGMFVFNADYMLKELQKNYKEGYENLIKLPTINDKNYNKELKEIYEKCESISIDYAVMEKSKNIYVIPSELGWDDIGTWKCLERYIECDENGNVAKGNIEFSSSTNCTAYSDKKRVVLLDVDDLYVIEGQDTIVVCKKSSIDKVKDFR